MRSCNTISNQSSNSKFELKAYIFLNFYINRFLFSRRKLQKKKTQLFFARTAKVNPWPLYTNISLKFHLNLKQTVTYSWGKLCHFSFYTPSPSPPPKQKKKKEKKKKKYFPITGQLIKEKNLVSNSSLEYKVSQKLSTKAK